MTTHIDDNTLETIRMIIEQYEHNYDQLDSDELDGMLSDCVDIFSDLIGEKK